jgi:hypothetical protein
MGEASEIALVSSLTSGDQQAVTTYSGSSADGLFVDRGSVIAQRLRLRQMAAAHPVAGSDRFR